MSRGAAGARRLRWKALPAGRLERLTMAAALLALAVAAGDCAAGAQRPADRGGVPGAEAGR